MAFPRLALAAVLLLWPCSHHAAAQPLETAIPDVNASLTYARVSGGVLRVGITLTNTSDQPRVAAGPIMYGDVVLVDAKTNRKHFPFKDENGHFLAGPISDWNKGGRWYPRLAPNSETLFWAMFDALPAGTIVSIQSPLLQPFDDVEITESAASPTDDPGTGIPPLRISFLSAKRASGELRVRLKIANPGKSSLQDSTMILYKNARVFDPRSKTLFSLVKDTEGAYLAQPVDDKGDGGRYFVSNIAPGRQVFMTLTFEAPPDSVRQVDVLIPSFGPIEAVPISGEGGASSGGASVAARSLGLDGALEALDAAVAEKTITVNLPADLLFDFDKADIKPEAEPSLAHVVTILKATPGATVIIEGHTDAKGEEAYNQSLSERRAATVAEWLTTRAKLAPGSIRTKGWGETKPVAHNTKPDGSDDPEGRTKNRRVEITVNRP